MEEKKANIGESSTGQITKKIRRSSVVHCVTDASRLLTTIWKEVRKTAELKKFIKIQNLWRVRALNEQQQQSGRTP